MKWNDGGTEKGALTLANITVYSSINWSSINWRRAGGQLVCIDMG
jgi:hypothetical protein